MSTTISSWADLPSDLLVKVSKCLKTRVENSRLRSVCTNWRSSIQNPIRFPIDFPLDFGDDHCCFRLTEKTIYCIEPAIKSSSSVKYWFICVEEAEGGKVHLINLFTGVRIQQLPPNFPTMLDLSNFRLTELQKLYRLELDVKQETNDLRQDFTRLNLSDSDSISDCVSKFFPPEKIIVRKVVLLSNSRDEDIVLVVLQRNGRLSFYKFGTTKKWILLKDMENIGSFDDIANYKGKLCAISGEGKSIIIDTSFNVSVIESNVYLYFHCCYLVESSGDLFLAEQKKSYNDFYDESYFGDIDLPDEEDFSFKIYKLYEEDFRWVEVTNMGDCVFFTSNRSSAYWSFCVRAIQVPSSFKYCIFFMDKENDMCVADQDDYGDLRQLMVFHLDTGKMDLIPGNFDMFWPPPNWLVTGNSSE